MTKEFIHEVNLEQAIVTHLRQKAQLDDFHIEAFSFNVILSEVQKKYDVDEKKLQNALDSLENDEELLVKLRTFKVYVPKGYEKKFSGWVSRIDPAIIPFAGLVLGYYTMWILLPNLQMNITNLSDSTSFSSLVFFGFFIPLILGSLALVILKAIFERVYKHIKIFRELVDFLGGTKVCTFALITATILSVFSTVLSAVVKSQIDPWYTTGGVFTATVIAILGLSRKHVSKE